MELSELNVKLRLDTSEIDTAIEKANQLLALLQKIRETGSQTEVSFNEFEKGIAKEIKSVAERNEPCVL